MSTTWTVVSIITVSGNPETNDCVYRVNCNCVASSVVNIAGVDTTITATLPFSLTIPVDISGGNIAAISNLSESLVLTWVTAVGPDSAIATVEHATEQKLIKNIALATNGEHVLPWVSTSP